METQTVQGKKSAKITATPWTKQNISWKKNHPLQLRQHMQQKMAIQET